MSKVSVIAIASAILFLASVVGAQVPGAISYQGRVVDDGMNFDGTGQFMFAPIASGAVGSSQLASHAISAANLVAPLAAAGVLTTNSLASPLMANDSTFFSNTIYAAIFPSNCGSLVWSPVGAISFDGLDWFVVPEYLDPTNTPGNTDCGSPDWTWFTNATYPNGIFLLAYQHILNQSTETNWVLQTSTDWQHWTWGENVSQTNVVTNGVAFTISPTGGGWSSPTWCIGTDNVPAVIVSLDPTASAGTGYGLFYMSVTNSLAPVSQWQWSSPIQLGGIFTNYPNEYFFDGKITSAGGTNYIAYLALGQIGIAYQTDVGFTNDWTTTATTSGDANPSILPNPQGNGWLMSYVPGAPYGYGYALDANAYAPNSNAWTFVGTADTSGLACGTGGGPVEVIPNSAAKTQIWTAVQSSTIFTNFTGTPTNGVVPLTVRFTDASFGSFTNWYWSFGDGSTTNVATTTVSHTYVTAGTYTVTEIVSGSSGLLTNTQGNYITALPPPPLASFTATPTFGVAPLTVTFTDTSVGSITNWFWIFGDGNTTNVTTKSVFHMYATGGAYSVTETVSGPGGSSTTTPTLCVTVLTPVEAEQFQAWQSQYFNCTTCPRAQPGVDADGTGQNNMFKYVAGLDPTNPASVFVLNIATDTNQPSENDLLFTPLALGRTYTPQFSTNLPGGVWLPLTTCTGPVTNNIGTQVTITDTNPIPPQEFYRIEISLP